MMTDSEILRVVEAHIQGKKIQFKTELFDWTNCANNEPAWEFTSTEYRVAPEPRKPREWWIHPKLYPDVEHEKDRILTEKPINPDWIHVREVMERHQEV